MRSVRHFIIAASDYATRSIIRRIVFATCTAITVSAVETSRAALTVHKCVGADIYSARVTVGHIATDWIYSCLW